MRIEQFNHGSSSQDTKTQHRSTAHKLMDYLLDPNTFDSSQVHIANAERLQNKLERMITAGSNALEVISDFDYTMSKFRHNGVRNPTCHGIFEMDPELTEAARTKLKALTDKYSPIEFDPHLPVEEKIPHMVHWWSTTHQTIVDCRLHRNALAKTVRECNLVLRDNVKEFTALLHQYGIPLLIFSAGLGDVIQLLLQRFDMDTGNVRIVSNFMRFNDEDVLEDFEEPIIHTFNKTAASIAHVSGGKQNNSLKRPCILLLGDSTGDVHMADGATVDDPEGRSGTVLRIGFLNNQVDKNLETYKTLYDIVLVDHDTFTVPLAVVQSILRAEKSGACSTSQGSSTSSSNS